MIQGPDAADLRTDLSQDEFRALARAADRGEAGAVEVFIDVLLGLDELKASVAPVDQGLSENETRRRVLEQLRYRALAFARQVRRGLGEVIDVYLTSEREAPGGLSIFGKGTLHVFCPATGFRYELLERIALLDGSGGQWAEFGSMKAIGPLLQPASITAEEAGVRAAMHRPARQRFENIDFTVEFSVPVTSEPESEAVWSTEPLGQKWVYEPERIRDTRGFGNTPLSLRARLKPWER